jgi:hypothetical protein
MRKESRVQVEGGWDLNPGGWLQSLLQATGIAWDALHTANFSHTSPLPAA